jgi:hypothetical protein
MKKTLNMKNPSRVTGIGQTTTAVGLSPMQLWKQKEKDAKAAKAAAEARGSQIKGPKSGEK